MRDELAEFVLRQTAEGAVLLLDAEGRVVYGVARGARFGGMEAVDLSGRMLSEFYSPPERKAQPRRHLEQASREGSARVQTECVGLDDRRFPAELVIERLQDGTGAHFACLLQDVTEQQKAAAAGAALAEVRKSTRGLSAERDRLLGIVQSIAQALLVLDRDWRVVYVNEQAESLLRQPRHELLGRDLRRKLGTTGTTALFTVIERAMTERVQVETEEFYPLSGTWFEILAYPGTHGVSMLFRDITERRHETQEALRSLTLFEPITGLPNRTLVLERLLQSVAQARRFGRALSVVAVEVEVADAGGADRAAYDELLLKVVTNAIEPLIRQNDTLGYAAPRRWVVIQDLGPLDGAATLSEKLIATIAEVPQVAEMNGRPVAGIAIMGIDGDTADELLRAAESALADVAGEAGSGYRYANAPLNQQVTARKALEQELRVGIEADQLRMFFQPEVDASTGRTIGLEALFRWEHPRRGILNAGEFLPVAAGTDLILPLGDWALRELSAQARAWRDVRGSDVRLSMNLTDAQLRSEHVPTLLAALLREHELPLDAVELEISEAQLLHHRAAANALCRRLHELGLSVCIDDFGAEFAAIGPVFHPAIHKLKLDAAVTARLDLTDRAALDLPLVAMLRVAQTFDLHVVAKGVESDEQLAALQRHGCQRVQGYLVGRPMPAAQLSATVGGS